MPPDPTSLYHEALQDYQASRFEDAAQKLLQLIADHPAFEDAYEALSVIFYHQKKYDAAIETLKKWLAVNPDAVMAHTNLSRCYMSKGMIAEAEHEQAQSRRLSWKAELKGKKPEVPKIDYEEQIQRYKKVIALDPADVLGYFTLGTTYLEASHKRDALEAFQKAIEVDPRHSSSYLSLGMTLEALGDLKKAAEIYAKGIQVADARGDVMTLRKMEARLRNL